MLKIEPTWTFPQQDAMSCCSATFKVPDAIAAAAIIKREIQGIGLLSVSRIAVRQKGEWRDVHPPLGGIRDNAEHDMGALQVGLHKYAQQHRQTAELEFESLQNGVGPGYA